MFGTDDVTILFAGAGAGKTTRLIKEITRDLQTYRPEDIAFVSYTRRGAYEGRDRVVKKLGVDEDRLEYFKTLHALTFSELGYSDKKVFTYKYAQLFNEALGFNLTTSKHDESNTLDDKLINLYDQRRSGHSDLNADVDGFDKLRYDRLVKAYEAFKKHHNLVDYTDCLVDFVHRGKAVPVRVAYIDEAQDLTALQWEVCKVAFSKAEKIFIAGDDYQSIYKYAGARPDVLIELARRHKVVKLETSYRLPMSVYRMAKSITDILGVKVDKDYRPFKDEEGSVRFINDRRIMAKIIQSRQEESWLVLFRTNYHAADFEEYLKAELVPYHTARGFVIGEDRLGKINKYYNFRKEGFGDEEAKKAFMLQHDIRNFNDDFCDSSLIEGEQALIFQEYINKYGIRTITDIAKAPPKIFVSTIHKVKGGEAKNVAVFLDCTQKIHRNRFRDFDSELRLLYVAFTRAQLRLFIVKSESRYGLDDIVETLKEHNDL